MHSTNTSSSTMPIMLNTHVGTRILNAFQSIGRSLMLPIAVLPAAGLLLRLGQPDLLNISWISAAGNAVFNNLSMIFAIGIAIGLTGGEGAAALASLVGFLVFTGVFNTLIPQVGGKPDPDISMGVLSGILIGLVTAELYRRFHDIRLPDYLAFFGGRRFVPMITALVALLLGVIFGWFWPTIQSVINALGTIIIALGPFGTGIYGFLNRLLIPLGLHHVLNTYIWFQLGTFTGAHGIVHGDLNRYFAGDPGAGNFMAGFFPIMMFGLPAACLAMIRHANFPKVAAGILLSAALTSFLTGVTEPIEFAFIFVAPMLYLLHAFLTGTSLAICQILNIKIGFSFSAGLFDYILNFSKANTTNPLLLLLIGLIYAILYYFIFSFFIVRLNLTTPGRDKNSTSLSTEWLLPESQRGPKNGNIPATSTSPNETTGVGDRDDILAQQVLADLGGRTNIQSIEGCITRLRLFVNDATRIDDTHLKSLGASGVVKQGKIVQVVMGTQSDRIASRIKRILKETNRDNIAEKESTKVKK